ncbi:portal protein [Synechococcus phage DSL-LC02]|nr:portal protein [Synechococcus phage DSL-LC02]
MSKLFGFNIQNSELKSPTTISPVPKTNEDGSDFYVASSFYGQYVDIEGVYRTEYDLLKRYREMSLHPECDTAIEHVVNEAIVADLNDSPVEIELSNLDVDDNIKNIIRQEFRYIKEIMDFDKKAHEIFRNWYVDGRIYYHKVIDLKRPEEGIKEVRYIDALKIKFVRELKKRAINDAGNLTYVNQDPAKELTMFESPNVDEYFVYNPQASGGMQTGSAYGKGIKIAKDAITYITSGLVDRNKQATLSYLHKAIKALNQLRMIEDSLVIYRLSRAPERRIFYIDVGNLPKVKAEQYLKEVMSRYRNKLVYDASTGEIKDDKKHLSMMEDFWLPRREGGRGTEITTLPGGQNLGELTDVEYFQKKLYRALNVPESRIAADGGFNLGRSSEILRDELMFSKFVGRLRKRFSQIFHDMLKTQLILKNIVTPEDWEYMSDHIQYDFLYDNHFAELKETELMNERLALLAQVEPYVGKYYSVDYVRRKVLRQTDEDIVEVDMQIDLEKQLGIIPPPMDPMTGMPMGGGDQGLDAVQDMGQVPTEPGISGSETEPPAGEQAPQVKMPKGGKI